MSTKTAGTPNQRTHWLDGDEPETPLIDQYILEALWGHSWTQWPWDGRIEAFHELKEQEKRVVAAHRRH